MYHFLCNEIKYMIIKFAIFADTTKKVLRLREVDSYFKFVVDDELFSVISNRVEKLPIFGRNHFCNVSQRIGDFSWCPRTNRVDIKLFHQCDMMQLNIRKLNKFSNEIYSGFLDNVWQFPEESLMNDFFHQIGHIFHPHDEYSCRLKFSFKEWKKYQRIQFYQKRFVGLGIHNMPSNTLDWSCRMIPYFGIGLDLCERDRFARFEFCEYEKLSTITNDIQLSCASIPIPTHLLLRNNNLFHSLIRPYQMQICRYRTICDYHPNLFHLFESLISNYNQAII